jgi:tetratricopeptide (TPR) repeat protein
MRNVVGRVCCTGVSVGLVCAIAWAGAQARLAGTVKDSAGKAIVGAVIIITTDELTGFDKRAETKKDGTFTILLLDATHHYKFRVEAAGYIPYEQPFKVAAGSSDNEFDFVLASEQEVRQKAQDKALDRPGYKELGEANALLQAGNKAAAEAKLEEAVKAVPALGPAWAALAQLAVDRGDQAKALERARKCLELDDESSSCLAIAANAAGALGDAAASQQYMARYQKANPDDPAAIFNEAAAQINQKNDATAKPLLEKCLQADPKFAKCLFEYGMLLFRSGDTAAAKTQLQKYLEVAPEGADAATAKEMINYL